MSKIQEKIKALRTEYSDIQKRSMDIRIKIDELILLEEFPLIKQKYEGRYFKQIGYTDRQSFIQIGGTAYYLVVEVLLDSLWINIKHKGFIVPDPNFPKYSVYINDSEQMDVFSVRSQ